jgi:hypothetical protein
MNVQKFSVESQEVRAGRKGRKWSESDWKDRKWPESDWKDRKWLHYVAMHQKVIGR